MIAQHDPVVMFGEWFAHAQSSGVEMSEAFALATSSLDGLPSVRMVLLRGFDARGFKFFTNYKSRKSKELIANPVAALCFHWIKQERQVRVEGHVEKTTLEESDAYWVSRARASRLSALASDQSKVLDTRESLQARVHKLEKDFKDIEIPRPEHWGGFRVVPHTIEFWQGQPHRLHDRLIYKREGALWKTHQLQP